jgi:hypothetical protein
VLLAVGVIHRVGCVIGERGEHGKSGAADVSGRDVNVQIDLQEGIVGMMRASEVTACMERREGDQ